MLDDKVTAVREIIRDRLANNFLTNANYTGDVYVLNQSHGCDGTVATATNPPIRNCLKFTVPLASWSGGIPPAGTQTNVRDLDEHFHNCFHDDIWRMDRQQHVDGSAAADSSFRAGRERLGAADCRSSAKPPVGEAADLGDGIVARVQQGQCPHPAGQHSSRFASRPARPSGVRTSI